MGVLSCSRRGCENIMCDIYIPEIGYICYECRKEFTDYLETINKTNLTEDELLNELKKFMTSSINKFRNKDKIINVDEFFDEHKR